MKNPKRKRCKEEISEKKEKCLFTFAKHSNEIAVSIHTRTHEQWNATRRRFVFVTPASVKNRKQQNMAKENCGELRMNQSRKKSLRP